MPCGHELVYTRVVSQSLRACRHQLVRAFVSRWTLVRRTHLIFLATYVLSLSFTYFAGQVQMLVREREC